MSDLTAFADHARAMAGAQHKPECPPRGQTRRWVNVFTPDGVIGEGRYEPPRCPGCVTDADRALWTRLADEADAWLARDDEEGLFG